MITGRDPRGGFRAWVERENYNASAFRHWQSSVDDPDTRLLG